MSERVQEVVERRGEMAKKLLKAGSKEVPTTQDVFSEHPCVHFKVGRDCKLAEFCGDNKWSPSRVKEKIKLSSTRMGDSFGLTP